MLASATRLSLGITAAFASVGAAGVKLYSSFESSFAEIRKSLSATENQFRQLEGAMRKLAMQLPVDVEQINALAGSAAALGIERKNLEEFTRTATELGMVSNIVGRDSVEAFIRLMGVLKVPQEEARRMASTFVVLAKQMITSESEILQMASKIAPASKTFGMTADQILGLSAALNSMGVEAGRGGMAFNGLILSMGKAVAEGDEKLQLFAAIAGQSASEFAEAFRSNALRSLLRFISGLQSVAKSGADVTGVLDQLGLDGALFASVLLRASDAQELLNKGLLVGARAWQENEGLTRNVSIQLDTFSAQVKIAWNHIKDFLITLGEQIVPTLKALNSLWQSSGQSLEVFGLTAEGVARTFASVMLTAIGLVGDAIQGWRMLIKSVQLALTGLAEVQNKIWSGIVRLFVHSVESMANSAIGILNAAIRLINQLAAQLPEWMQPKVTLREIKWKLSIDTEGLSVVPEALEETRKEFSSELESLASQPKFSERLLSEYDKVVQGIKRKNREVAQNVNELTQNVSQAFSFPEEHGTRIAERMLRTRQVTEMIHQMRPPSGMGVPGYGMAGSFLDQNLQAAVSKSFEKEAAQKNLEQLRSINEQDVDLTRETLLKKQQLMEGYIEELKHLRAAETQIILSSGQATFDSLASIAEGFAGKQSDIYKAMFAASKAFAIAESIVKIQQGIAGALALPFPANLAAMASVVAATANIVSTIQSVRLTFEGGKARGGPVRAGASYWVGEEGPELFVPNRSGSIVPNGAVLSSSVKVVVHNYSGARTDVREREEGGGRVIDIVVQRVKSEIGSDIADGRGVVTRALEQSFGLRRGRA
jgi:TP901 family phage tail tape measure protein